MHPARRHTDHRRQVRVVLITRQELSESLPYALRLRFVVKPLPRFVPNSERKDNRVLCELSPASLFLFGAPNAFKVLSPLHAGHCRSNSPHKPAGLVVEVNWSLG